MPAQFYEQDISSKLTGKRKLSDFLDALVHKYRKGTKNVSLSYIFCTDKFLHQMNMEYLHHDTLTDIITFDLSAEKTEVESEIYISVNRVRENAKEFGVSYKEELHRVIFHGALHLCGFKDKATNDKKKMRAMEEKCLKAYNS